MSNKLLLPQAKRLYLEGKDAGDILKIFPQLKSSTLYTWIKKFRWAELRDTKLQSYTESPEIMLGMLEDMVKQVPDMLKNEAMTVPEKSSALAKIADSISKITKSIKSLSKDKDRLSSIIFSVEQLGMFINKYPDKSIVDDEFLIKFDKILSGFQTEMLEKFSPKNLS